MSNLIAIRGMTFEDACDFATSPLRRNANGDCESLCKVELHCEYFNGEEPHKDCPLVELRKESTGGGITAWYEI